MSAYWEDFAKEEKLYYDMVLDYIIRYSPRVLLLSHDSVLT